MNLYFKISRAIAFCTLLALNIYATAQTGPELEWRSQYDYIASQIGGPYIKEIQQDEAGRLFVSLSMRGEATWTRLDKLNEFGPSVSIGTGSGNLPGKAYRRQDQPGNIIFGMFLQPDSNRWIYQCKMIFTDSLGQLDRKIDCINPIGPDERMLANTAIKRPGGGFLIRGHKYLPSRDCPDHLLITTDENFNPLDYSAFPPTLEDTFPGWCMVREDYTPLLTSKNRVFLRWQTINRNIPSPNTTLRMFMLDRELNIERSRDWPWPENNVSDFEWMGADNAGNIVVLTESRIHTREGVIGSHYLTVVDSNLNIVSRVELNHWPGRFSSINFVEMLPDNTLLLAGSGRDGRYINFLERITLWGESIWLKEFDQIGFTAIASANDGGYFLAGRTLYPDSLGFTNTPVLLKFATDTITAPLTSARPQVTLPGVSVAPNPFRTQLRVVSPAGGEFTLYDLQGRVLMQRTLPRGNQAIDVAEFAPGLYPYRFSTAAGTVSGKLRRE